MYFAAVVESRRRRSFLDNGWLGGCRQISISGRWEGARVGAIILYVTWRLEPVSPRRPNVRAATRRAPANGGPGGRPDLPHQKKC